MTEPCGKLWYKNYFSNVHIIGTTIILYIPLMHGFWITQKLAWFLEHYLSQTAQRGTLTLTY